MSDVDYRKIVKELFESIRFDGIAVYTHIAKDGKFFQAGFEYDKPDNPATSSTIFLYNLEGKWGVNCHNPDKPEESMNEVHEDFGTAFDLFRRSVQSIPKFVAYWKKHCG